MSFVYFVLDLPCLILRSIVTFLLVQDFHEVPTTSFIYDLVLRHFGRDAGYLSPRVIWIWNMHLSNVEIAKWLCFYNNLGIPKAWRYICSSKIRCLWFVNTVHTNLNVWITIYSDCYKNYKELNEQEDDVWNEETSKSFFF